MKTEIKKNQKLIVSKAVKIEREKMRLKKIIDEHFTFFEPKNINHAPKINLHN